MANMTLQCVRLTENMTFNSNSNLCRVTAFFDIEKAFFAALWLVIDVTAVP
jgi:hypothetical protein